MSKEGRLMAEPKFDLLVCICHIFVVKQGGNRAFTEVSAVFLASVTVFRMVQSMWLMVLPSGVLR